MININKKIIIFFVKMMTHIIKIYTKKTNIKKKELKEILKKDAIWNLKECLENWLIIIFFFYVLYIK